MEKITLKPTAKELIYKNGEENVHFDVLSYQGTGNQEKVLGSLFIVGQIKYSEENLSYAVSLISSLAKREYYSDQSLQTHAAKGAFEHMLKKLNEVLDDFFKSKDLKLNIGLVAICGNDIYISRLGKFKIALARAERYVDVLNNIDLFNKDPEDAKQFSNIISGKLQVDDKIFAYFPTRPITAREKQLNDIFVKENQDVFSEKIGQLAVNANNFSCCGVHINMKQVKEIPVQAMPNYSRPAQPAKTEESTPIQEQSSRVARPISQSISIPESQEETEGNNLEKSLDKIHTEAINKESQRIIPAELSVAQRGHLLTPVIKQFSKLANLGKLPLPVRRRIFITLAAIILIPTLGVIFWKSNIRSSNQAKNVIRQAEESLRVAQSRLDQSNFREARSLLQAALSNTTGLTGKNVETVRQEINQTLDGIDHSNDKQPQLFFDLSGKSEFRAILLAGSKDNANITDSSGKVLSVNQSGASDLNQFEIAPKFIFNTNPFTALFNGLDTFAVYDPNSKKSTNYSLKEPVQATDAVLYENNLYILSGNQIFKYADITTGGTKRTDWGGDTASGNQISIAADGNIYTLNKDGKLVKYFKGKKVSETDLQVLPSSDSKILTSKDSAFLYLTSKSTKRLYVFDKADGTLKTTYKLDLVGSIQDMSVSTTDGSVWILSVDNKIWIIR